MSIYRNSVSLFSVKKSAPLISVKIRIPKSVNFRGLCLTDSRFATSEFPCIIIALILIRSSWCSRHGSLSNEVSIRDNLSFIRLSKSAQCCLFFPKSNVWRRINHTPPQYGSYRSYYKIYYINCRHTLECFVSQIFISPSDVISYVVPILRHILDVGFALTQFIALLYGIFGQRKEIQDAVQKYEEKASHSRHLRLKYPLFVHYLSLTMQIYAILRIKRKKHTFIAEHLPFFEHYGRRFGYFCNSGLSWMLPAT